MKNAFHRNHGRTVAIAAASILVVAVWAYSDSLFDLAARWEADPQYSHGYIVPIFAGILLWSRRKLLSTSKVRPNWFGLPVLATALAVRHAAIHLYLGWFEQLSIVGVAIGAVLTAGGWHALRWAWPACLFLVFMIPLPYSLEVALREPLRQAGTVASTYVMQTVGLPAVAEGMIIAVGDVRIGVAEACSGLRMLMVFFALATAVAMMGDQPVWRRLVIMASAVPIALISNVVRITTTGYLHAVGYSEFADLVFHDLAGWLMMPLGLLMLWAESAFLNRLILTESEEPMLGSLLVGGVSSRSPGGASVTSRVALGAK